MTQKSQKKPAWRIAAFILGATAIVIMWAGKDVAGRLAGMPPEQALPMVITGAAVTLLKAAVIAGAAFLIKWLVGKIKK